MFSLRKLLMVAPIALICSISVLLTSCGSGGVKVNSIVKDVALETKVENDGDAYIGVRAMFNLGSMSMTSIKLPIQDPHNKDIVYGIIEVKPTFGSQFSEVNLRVNLTDTAKIQAGYPTLPNGEELPIGGLDDKHVIEIQIPQIHSKIYIGLAHDLTMIGFAIGIKEFQVVGDYIANANVFLGFDIKGFVGNAGLFTGDGQHENGLAFFADFSKIITQDILTDIIMGNKISKERYAAMKTTLKEIEQFGEDSKYSVFNSARYKTMNNNKRNMKGLYKAMRKIGRRKLTY